MERIKRAVKDKTAAISDGDLRRRLLSISRGYRSDIGVFFVDDNVSKVAWADPETGFAIEPGEAFAEMHLLVDANIVRREILDSFVGIAYYIKSRDDIKYVLTTTYKKMAQLMSHFGFTLSARPYPKDEKYMRYAYPETSRGIAGKPIEDVFLIFQERDQFIKRFLPCEVV